MEASARSVGAVLVAGIAIFSWGICRAQNASDGTTTIWVDTSLVLVDVIAENAKTALHSRALLTDLRREDFRIFDNGHEMPISSFDIGAQNTTRPIALWLIVQCNQIFRDSQHDKPGYHSAFMQGKTEFLKPALTHLGKNDAVGVAHWCDNGESLIDLPPGQDSDAALTKIEDVLSQRPIVGETRTGELTMQRMIRTILKNTHETTPARLPIFLFFYGDGSGTRAEEANNVLTDLLETSGLVFGINDGSWPYDARIMFTPYIDEHGFSGPHVRYLVHYYSQETGGEVYSTLDPKLFASALDYILTQLHFRYTIGFKPEKLDGKRHTLKVELTPEARKTYPAAELRFRPEYIPVAVPESFR